MDPFLGEIIMFGGNFAPRGWALCHGQLLAISQNQALFSLLGTTYGGDGRTTFGLPDLRGRAPISPGSGPGLPTYRWGQKGGEATHVLTLQELPQHNHVATATVGGTVRVGTSSAGPDTPTANGGVLASASGIYNEEDADGSLGGVSQNLTSTVTINNNGGGQAHNNMQPFTTVNYIIATTGTFPSRS